MVRHLVEIDRTRSGRSGHTSFFSTFQVRSPASKNWNRPSENRIARLRALSEVSTGRSGGADSHNGLAASIAAPSAEPARDLAAGDFAS